LMLSCRDIGRGGTGEMVVPDSQLREIRAVEPANLGTAPAHPPSTLPSTRATTQPLAEVPLTLADVRRLALHNNLDLKVDLISPAIARESLNEEEARYEALFTADAGYSSNDAPVPNEVEQQISGTESQDFNVTPGLTFP